MRKNLFWISMMLPLVGNLFYWSLWRKVQEKQSFAEAYRKYVNFIPPLDVTLVAKREKELSIKLRESEGWKGTVNSGFGNRERKLRLVLDSVQMEKSQAALILNELRRDSDNEIAVAASGPYFELESYFLNQINICKSSLNDTEKNEQRWNLFADSIVEYLRAGYVAESKRKIIYQNLLMQARINSLEINPNQPWIHLALAKELILQMNYEEALFHLEKTKMLLPGKSDADIWISEVYFLMKKYASIHDVLEKSKCNSLLEQKIKSYWIKNA